MSTFIIHFLIPPLMILATGYFPARYVWAFVWVGIVGDLDYIGWILYVNDIVPINTHRAILHNVWILVVLGALAAWRYRRFRDRVGNVPGGAFHAYAQTRAGAGWLLACYYYFSHLLLDSFQGGIVPFWPLLDYNAYYSFELLVDTETQRVEPRGEAQFEPGGAPMVSEVYRWLSSEQFAFILLLATSLGLGHLYRTFGPRVKMVRAVAIRPLPAPAPREAGRASPDPADAAAGIRDPDR